jgi:hypothetical protein
VCIYKVITENMVIIVIHLRQSKSLENMLRSSLQTSGHHQELVDMLRSSLQTPGRHQELVERLRHIHDNGSFPTYVEMFYLRSLTKRLPDLTISVTRRVLIRQRNRLYFANTWISPRFCWLGACWSSY